VIESVTELAAGPLYKGLDPFRDNDVDIADFAGREADVEALFARLLANRTVVLYGRSGLGKTSLLLAGLFPRLRNQGYFPLYVRLLASPLGDLTATLAEALRRTSPPSAADDLDAEPLATQGVGRLVDALATSLATGNRARRPLVVVFDQFEEFFTNFGKYPRERRAFIHEVAALARDETTDVRFLFSLREDLLSAVDELQRHLTDLFAGAYRLLPLSALGAREALTRPLKNREIPYDDRLINALLDALAKQEFESAHLQLAACEVALRARQATEGGSRLTLEIDDVEKIRRKGADGLFRRYLSNAIQQVPPELEMDARTVLDVLITESETKLARREEELSGVGLEPAELRRVLAALETSQLVRSTPVQGHTYYELRHDSLIREIRSWQRENPSFADFLDARTAIRSYGRDLEFQRRPARLLSADMLRQAVSPNWRRLPLDAVEAEFVLWSAMRNGVDDRAAWAQRWEERSGRPVSTVLAEMLRHEHADIRSGGAEGVPLLASDDRELVRACLALMVDAQQPERVREAAVGGAAMALTGQPDEQIIEAFLDVALAPASSDKLCRLAGREFARRAEALHVRVLRKRLGRFRNPDAIRFILAQLYDTRGPRPRQRSWPLFRRLARTKR
jgi:hypothetical protein